MVLLHALVIGINICEIQLDLLRHVVTEFLSIFYVIYNNSPFHGKRQLNIGIQSKLILADFVKANSHKDAMPFNIIIACCIGIANMVGTKFSDLLIIEPLNKI